MAAMLCEPDPEVARYAWVPLVIDLGCLLWSWGSFTALCGSKYSRKKRTPALTCAEAPGALRSKEAIGSWPWAGTELSSTTRCTDGAVARSLSASR